MRKNLIGILGVLSALAMIAYGVTSQLPQPKSASDLTESWLFPAAASSTGPCVYFPGGLPSLTRQDFYSPACDINQRFIVVGAGTAGTPVGGVESVQGVSGGQALPVSGNVGITGTLPAFASTPAFSISGTLPAFASTPAFSISGTLPAFAATPTVTSNAGTGTFNVAGTGTAGSPGSAVLTVQGIASGTAQPISGNVGITGTLPAFAATPAFSISGTLPAFASTPTVIANAGTGTENTQGSQATGVAASANPVLAGIQDSGGVDYLNGCDKVAFGNPASTTDAVLIAHSASKVIYICGYSIESSGAVNLTFESAAAGSCGTETAASALFYLGAQSGLSDPSPFYRGFNVASGSDLCTHLSAAVGVAVTVYYAQR